jgi:hypothetical protein
MRRIVFFLAVLVGLATPAAALAVKDGPNDGTLVVKNATAPADGADKTAVVRLTITGSVIGQVTGQSGRIIIDGGAKSPAPEVTGAGAPHDVKASDTAQAWTGDVDGFKFRAVGGTYTIVIYGSGVSLVAIGTGSVVLTGTPDSATDGRYSLNGDDFKSLPGVATKPLVIGTVGTSSTA